MRRHSHPPCDAPSPFDPRQRCPLDLGHYPGTLHAVTLTWRDDDADTMKLPPVRESIGPRRRPPAFEALTERAELLEAMGRELQRELAELRDDTTDDIDGDR